jgi:hypothetical protein
LFNDSIPTAEFIQVLIRCENDHEQWVEKDLEGGGHGLFEDNILAFVCKH